ncbi:hypothetical protein ACQJBY_011910 [Aegilops geniculata]
MDLTCSPSLRGEEALPTSWRASSTSRPSQPSSKIVEKLVDIIIFLDKQIRDAFGEAVPVDTDFMEQGQNKRLGSCGLPLHYANIINQTENIVASINAFASTRF